MHGSVLHGFKQFVVGRHGEAVWTDVCRAAGVDQWYFATGAYADDLLPTLVSATAHRTGSPADRVLEDAGAALVPVLVAMYGSFIDPTWTTIDLLLNTEQVMHQTIRMRDPNASPPRIHVIGLAGRAVEITYTSERRLCHLAVGICRGVAAHYGEVIDVDQLTCMLRGDAACRLTVAVRPTAPAPAPAG